MKRILFLIALLFLPLYAYADYTPANSNDPPLLASTPFPSYPNGCLPNTGADETACLTNLLNFAAGRPVQLQLGAYIVSSHLTSGISGGTTSTTVNLLGATPCKISDDSIPGQPYGVYLINPAAGSTFNQFTPPSTLIAVCTVIQFAPTSDDGLFGQPDSGSAYGYDNTLKSLTNLVVWGGSTHALWALHEQGQDIKISGVTVAMMKDFGILLRGGGDNPDISAGLYDNGWGLTPTGSLSGTTPTYGSGADFYVAATGTPGQGQYQDYVGFPTSGTATGYTQVHLHDSFIWHRVYWNTSMWGCGGIQTVDVYDITIDNVQSWTMGCSFGGTSLDFRSTHVESFDELGPLETSVNVGPWLFYNAPAVPKGGWIGTGFQAHYGQGSPASSITGAISGTMLTVSGVASGTVVSKQNVGGTGVTGGTLITALGSGTGGNGTYTVSPSQSVGSRTLSTYFNNPDPFVVINTGVYGSSGTGGPPPAVIAMNVPQPKVEGPPLLVNFPPMAFTVNSGSGNNITWSCEFCSSTTLGGGIYVTITITEGTNTGDMDQWFIPVHASYLAGAYSILYGTPVLQITNVPATWTEVLTPFAAQNGTGMDFSIGVVWTNWSNGTLAQVDVSPVGGSVWFN